MSLASVTLPLVVLLFVAGMGLTGVFLLLTGWRGQRLDNHPVCRRCRFDLTGTPRGDEDAPPRCPECGWRREPRLGNRRRSGGRVASGAVLLLLTATGVGLAGFNQIDAAGLAPHKPVWWLRLEARGASSVAETALRELTARVVDDRLSGVQAERLVADALIHGPAGDPAIYHASIGSTWDRLAAALMRADHGRHEQHIALARSWLDLSVRVGPQVESGGALPLELAGGTYGPPTDVGLWRTPQLATVSVKGATFPIGYSRSGPMHGGRGFGPATKSQTVALEPGRGLPPESPVEFPPGLPPGSYTLRVERPVEITDGPSGAVLAAWTHVEELMIEIARSADEPIATDPSRPTPTTPCPLDT